MRHTSDCPEKGIREELATCNCTEVLAQLEKEKEERRLERSNKALAKITRDNFDPMIVITQMLFSGPTQINREEALRLLEEACHFIIRLQQGAKNEKT